MAARVVDSWRAAARAGFFYALIVFAIGFVVGTIRVLLVVPRAGALAAVLLEAPVMLAASWSISRGCIRRFDVHRDFRARALMGAVAFSVLMLTELGVSVWVFGEFLKYYVANLETGPGAIGLTVQVCFAAIPCVQLTRRFGGRR